MEEQKTLFTRKSLSVDLLELNEGQLSVIDPDTNEQIGLGRNPRWIRDTRFEALKKSIESDPEYMEVRELVVYTLSSLKDKNGKFIVIGGNMRLRACLELGWHSVPCKILSASTPMEKLRAYAIKDNEAFGQNDYDILSGNEWNAGELQEWGMELDYLNAGSVDFDSVDNLEEDKYEAPKTKMLECPHCHHVDMAIHFRAFEGNTDKAEQGESAEEEDMPNNEL